MQLLHMLIMFLVVSMDTGAECSALRMALSANAELINIRHQKSGCVHSASVPSGIRGKATMRFKTVL